MSGGHWAVIGLLALMAFLIRVAGLMAGERIRASRLAWMLDELPGLIVVSLVASSLIGQTLPTWISAGAALGIAVITNNVIATMAVGVLAFASLTWLGG
ncbi:branched-chain amino acid transporter (plasmid) [Salipiger sp. CCB-MM3]|uniref:AzlD domain-containing protein n=1 Tax=Salipiger sp. CCB-MM3 TaxID=1792508 RepID=UPI00080AAF79|nr:AzlD domain-containing protein [Salipiger sp. CCB-MM3]ANT63114.1 branched-chain amino acid transporter [Salipiger sp. CCB-MM3]